MIDLAAIRRLPSGRLLFGLSHAQVWALVTALVVIVLLVLYRNRR